MKRKIYLTVMSIVAITILVLIVIVLQVVGQKTKSLIAIGWLLFGVYVIHKNDLLTVKIKDITISDMVIVSFIIVIYLIGVYFASSGIW